MQRVQRLSRKILPWLIWSLLVVAVTGAVICYDPNDLSKAAMFVGTILGIWVAALTAFVTSRRSEFEMIVTAKKHFHSRETMVALRILGPIWNDERRRVKAGSWSLEANVGVRYLQIIEAQRKEAQRKEREEEDPTGELDQSRRELSGVYDSVCALVNQGIVTRSLAVSVFVNLEERAKWLTAIEEFLALKLSATRFEEEDDLVRAWNKSRERGQYDDIEVGKPNMRAFSGMRLILDGNKASRCDYDDAVLIVNPKRLFTTDTEGRLRLVLGGTE